MSYYYKLLDWIPLEKLIWWCLSENPDYNEPDYTVAFRKRSEKEKIKTRPKLEVHLKKLKKGEAARD